MNNMHMHEEGFKLRELPVPIIIVGTIIDNRLLTDADHDKKND